MDAPIESHSAHVAQLEPAGEPPFADMAAGTALFVIALALLALVYVLPP